MFVDLWVVSIFSILFGVCAVWNRMRGIHVGIEKTLDKLVEDRIIRIVNDRVVRYTPTTRRRNKKTAIDTSTQV